MPNWCYTSYVIEGQRKEVQSLYSQMNRLEKRKKSLVENGFGKAWLGNLVTALGADWNQIRCRGSWFNLDYDQTNKILRFDTETAWTPMFETFALVEEKYPSLKIFWQATEEGMEIYETNDIEGKYFPYRYLLDNYEEPLYYETIEEAAESVSGIVGHKKVKPDYNEIVHALDDYTEKQEAKGGEDVFFSFHEFEVVDDNGNKVLT